MSESAAAYIRMSTDRQEDSPKQQRAEIRKLAKRENVEIVAWYEDHGITGDSIDERPDFRRMLNDADSGQFSVVICDNQDRFGRFDSIDAGMVISPLRKSGVRLLTNAQGWIDWRDFATRMVFAIQAEGKHQFLIDLSRNITRSFANSQEARTFIRSAPLGMCRVFYDQHGREQTRANALEHFRRPHAWSVRLAPSNNEQEREGMRWAFETYANTDAGLHEICRGLQSRGVVSRMGTRLAGNVLRSLFTNKKYIGVVEAGNFAKGKYHRVDADGNIAKAGDVPTGRSDARRGRPVKVFERAGEPLIDRETFEKVQQKLASRGVKGRKPRRNNYLLTGILRCGHCDGPMHGKSRKNVNDTSGYYLCNGRRTGECDGHRIRQDLVEEHVFDVIRNSVFRPDMVSRIKSQISAISQQRQGRDESRYLNEQLRKINGKLERARRNLAVADVDDVPTVQAVILELKQQVAATETKLRGFDESDSTPLSIATRAAAMVEAGSLFDADCVTLKHALSETFDKITLWFERPKKRCILRRGVVTIRRAG